MKPTKISVFIVILFLILICNTASAEDVIITGEVSVFSKYIGKSGAEKSDGPVMQGSATLCYKSFYLYTWFSGGLFDEWNNGTDDEINFGLGKTFTINNTTLNLSAIYFACYDINIGDNDSYALAGTLSHKGGINPYLYVRSYTFVDDDYQGGTFYILGVKPVYGVINFDINLLGHNGLGGKPAKAIEKIGIGLSRNFDLGNNIYVTPKICYNHSLSNGTSRGGLTDSKLWSGITLSW